MYLAVEGEEEDEGDPICLFCPPDVSESRLRDLVGGGGGLKLLNHLRPWLMNTNTPRSSGKSRSFSFVGDKNHGSEQRMEGLSGNDEGKRRQEVVC